MRTTEQVKCYTIVKKSEAFPQRIKMMSYAYTVRKDAVAIHNEMSDKKLYRICPIEIKVFK